MKKLVLILLALMIVLPIFADKKDDALEESTKLLSDALDKIEELEFTIIQLDKALSDNNIVLQDAYDRIDKDGIEIEELRGAVKTLIKNGVEFKTYDWNVIVTTGYPASLGLMAGYNLPFLTNLGFVAGFDYNFDNMIPAFKVGIKINLGKN